jgi:transcriptional regulator with XRE-family HTH domain
MDLKVEDLLILLGERIRELRLREDIAQTVLGARSGISLKAVKNLENGTGATVASLLRVLRTLGRTEWIETLGPKVGISPMQLLTRKKVRIRASRKKAEVKRSSSHQASDHVRHLRFGVNELYLIPIKCDSLCFINRNLESRHF